MAENQYRAILGQLGINYELREYDVDPEDLAAETVAAKIALPPEQVFKTLVARGDRNAVCMAVIPGNVELDLKALATASENPTNRAGACQGTAGTHRMHPGRRNCAGWQEELPRVRGRDYPTFRRGLNFGKDTACKS